MPNIGIPSLILILIVALIIFGPKKLPEIGKAAGQTLREFKKSTRDLSNNDEDKDTDKDSNQSNEDTFQKTDVK